MSPGDVLKTRYDAATPAGLWKAYGAIGGPAVTTFGQSKLIGVYNSEVVKNGVTFIRVLLFSPVTYQGTAYRYVFMEAAKLFAAPVSADVTYYPSGASANIRQDPSLTSAKLGSVAKGTAIGTGNGVFVNGFLRIKLRTPLNGWTYAWCSTNVITSTAPGSTGKPAPVIPPDPGGMIPDPNILDKPETTVENLLGEDTARWAKWVMLGVGVLIIGLIVWQLAKPDKKKGK